MSADSDLVLVLSGQAGCGKSTFAKAFVDAVSGMNTVHMNKEVVSLHQVSLEVDGRPIRITIRDLSGNAAHVRPIIYSGADMHLLVYNVHDWSSFAAVKKMHLEIIELYNRSGNVDAPFFGVLALIWQCGRRREVKNDHGREFAAKIQAPFNEVRVMDSIQVESAVVEYAKSAVELKAAKVKEQE